MLLSPSNFEYNNTFNKRSILNPSSSINDLSFGTQGLIPTGNVVLTAQNMFSMNLLLNNSASSSDNTFSKLWFNAFPHLPLTNKVVGARMGKGNGNLHSWFTIISSGNTIFEVNNLSIGSFYYFCKQIESSLGTKCLNNVKYYSFNNSNYCLNKRNTAIKFSLFN